MAAIKVKMNTLFAEGTDLEKKLYNAIREYNTFDKSKLTDLFTGSILHFSKNSTVDEHLFNDLKEIIMADGKIDHTEASALEALERMIEGAKK